MYSVLLPTLLLSSIWLVILRYTGTISKRERIVLKLCEETGVAESVQEDALFLL